MKPFVVRVRSRCVIRDRCYFSHMKSTYNIVFSCKCEKCRDGLERVSLSPGATVGDLKTAIRTNLSIPLEKQHISQDPRLVRLIMRCVTSVKLQL